MAQELEVRLYLIGLRANWVLEVIKDVHLSASGFGSDDILALRHISGLVDLTSMVDLSVHCNPLVFGLCSRCSRLSVWVPHWLHNLVS